MKRVTDKFTNRTIRSVGVIGAVLGAGLFVYFVKRSGLNAIAGEIRQLGMGFLIIIAISTVRQVARSVAWILCMDEPGKLHFWDAFRARVMGDAIGNLIPFGSFAIAEPAKPLLIRERVPLMSGLSAIAIENIFYSLSVGLFIFSGAAALLLNFTLPKGLRVITIITVCVILLIIGVGFLFFRTELRVIRGFDKLIRRCGLNPRALEKACSLEDRVYEFAEHSRSRFVPILLLEACFHLAGVSEVYVTLMFISAAHRPSFLTAFILESVNRVITITFKFIPLRMGVDEFGTGSVSKILSFTETTGVTLAIIRKARDLFWASVGIVLLFQRSLSLRAKGRQSQSMAGTRANDDSGDLCAAGNRLVDLPEEEVVVSPFVVEKR